MLIVGHAEERKWKPNEAYFLQAIGDQMLMSVSHTRLRSLVRRMGVSDERSGLLSRSSYQSCLLTEADRARTQGTPLALTILQIDRGAEILRQQGESPLERFLEQLARSLQPIVRQNDVAVKYTSWSLAFILPDTALAGAQNLADKLLIPENSPSTCSMVNQDEQRGHERVSITAVLPIILDREAESARPSFRKT
jgi:GGDEF domain-containing protein